MNTTVFFAHLGGPIEPRRNTVLLTNLPPDATRKTLLDRLMMCAPFGRLYSAHINKTDPPRGYGPPIVRALVAFFTTDAAQHLINYVHRPGIVFHQRILAADWSPVDVPEDDYPDHPNASRSVIVFGPKFQVDKRDIIALLENAGIIADYHNVQSRDRGSEHQVLLVFTTYTAAKQAIQIIRVNRRGLSVVYGRDPMEFGVTTKISSADRNKLSIYFDQWFYETHTHSTTNINISSGAFTRNESNTLQNRRSTRSPPPPYEPRRPATINSTPVPVTVNSVPEPQPNPHTNVQVQPRPVTNPRPRTWNHRPRKSATGSFFLEGRPNNNGTGGLAILIASTWNRHNGFLLIVAGYLVIPLSILFVVLVITHAHFILLLISACLPRAE